MGGLITAAVIAVVLAAVMLIPIRLHVLISYSDSGAGLDFDIKYGFIRLRIGEKQEKSSGNDKRSAKKKDENKPERHGKSFRENLIFIRGSIGEIKELIYAVLNYIFKRLIKIKLLSIKLILGLDDAMNTALIYGAVSSFIFNALGVIDRKMRLVRHSEEIKPDFDNPHILAECEAIISTNIFHAIAVAVIALWHGVPLYRKYRRN